MSAWCAGTVSIERRHAALTARGWAPDYLTVRRRSDLQPPEAAVETTSTVLMKSLVMQSDILTFIPRKGRERWMALRQQAMADGLLDAALLARYESFLRPEEKRWPDWSKGQMKKIDGVLDQLEAEVKALKGRPTIGTITIGCALGYLDYRFASHDWRAKRPKSSRACPEIA